MFKEIIGKAETWTGPYRVALVQTSDFPDGKMFLRQNDSHDSAFILIVSNRERYDIQRFNIQRFLGRKCELLTTWRPFDIRDTLFAPILDDWGRAGSGRSKYPFPGKSVVSQVSKSIQPIRRLRLKERLTSMGLPSVSGL
jgi:hypothetical protein